MMMTFPNVIFQSVLMYCLHSGCVCCGKFEDCILSYPPKWDIFFLSCLMSLHFLPFFFFADIFILLLCVCECVVVCGTCVETGNVWYHWEVMRLAAQLHRAVSKWAVVITGTQGSHNRVLNLLVPQQDFSRSLGSSKILWYPVMHFTSSLKFDDATASMCRKMSFP